MTDKPAPQNKAPQDQEEDEKWWQDMNLLHALKTPWVRLQWASFDKLLGLIASHRNADIDEQELVDLAHAKWRSITPNFEERFDTYSTGFVHGHKAASDRWAQRVAEIEKRFDKSLASQGLDLCNAIGRIAKLEARIEKLREALAYYANKDNWYNSTSPKNDLKMVIGSLDTEGNDWVGGRGARMALAADDKERT